MSGKRQNEIDLLACKSDIIKDIVADNISKEIHRESGIACSRRENAEIRLNLIKLEELVKEYDLDNPAKEVAMYEKLPPEERKVIKEEDFRKDTKKKKRK